MARRFAFLLGVSRRPATPNTSDGIDRIDHSLSQASLDRSGREEKNDPRIIGVAKFAATTSRQRHLSNEHCAGRSNAENGELANQINRQDPFVGDPSLHSLTLPRYARQ